MDEDFKNYEKSIKVKHSVHFTPRYSETFQTSVNSIKCLAIAEKVFEKLDWDLVFKDETHAEAKRKFKSLGTERWTEAIAVTYDNGTVTVKSQSLGNEMWDAGRNSKRVKVFIHVYNEVLKTFDEADLNALEKEVERKNNWDDYVIPETLPQPKPTKKPQFILPVIGGLILALLLGYVLATVSIEGMYFIGLFEVLVGISIAFILLQLLKFSNFIDFSKIRILLIAMIILTYFLNQYFQYEIILNRFDYERIGFGQFIKVRFETGLTIKSMNTGWIGLLISWILQLGLTYMVAYLRLVMGLTKFTIERVPMEVNDFAYYLFVKGKTEAEVREELSKKGWSDPVNQDEVFEALGGMQGANELNRAN